MQKIVEPLIIRRLAQEIGCQEGQVRSVVELMQEGATIPFIARYRKEVTGGLDDIQLRKLDERFSYLSELSDRCQQIVKLVEGQGKMTSVLLAKLAAAATKTELEDLYAPYKVKTKTRAQTAIENGLEPLVDQVIASPNMSAEELAVAFVTDKVPTVADAIAGARDIIAERIADNADTARKVREKSRAKAKVATRVVEGKEKEAEKYAAYFDHIESWSTIPSHRALAILRASKQGLITLDMAQTEQDVTDIKVGMAADNKLSLVNPLLSKAVDWAWRVKLSNRIHTDLVSEMRERAEKSAIEVFVRNLKDLLLAAPAGPKVTMGLDPGIRTGVKVAVVDKTGKLVETATVYPFQPHNDISGAIMKLRRMVETHKVELIAIGNGTASRETDKLAAELIARVDGKKPSRIIVSEAGASVYSASELASKEMPNIDVSLRGAVSIARRLQDPLAELVKIEPKAIGVGQYQHDVDEMKLARALEGAVEDAVNAVGVDVNTASAPLLSHIAGLGPALAQAIVEYRDANGAFSSRKDLLKVPRLGEKAFKQCAGFLRILNGNEPLDASAVHPEAYEVARNIVKACGRDLRSVMSDPKALGKLKPETFVTSEFGLPTVRDIFEELKKPGRDPRPEFKAAKLSDAVHEITDLKVGMKLEGTVTNVAAFGAFVDIGVHQDGLVHVSQLSDRFVKDTSEIVSTGKIVSVTVISVDVKAKKIGLSMKSHPDYPGADKSAPKTQTRTTSASPPKENKGNTAFADAFKRALR
ncbi:Tex family protein [Rhizobium sp. MHM7A]|uniref:Tex family protein n=1 Tax=Rhizobium sp. MHM7A TaxID=2583233 RepID=UPI0011064242|nr:Tex family protein [Rhizobium sp. MHM7A]TLX17293.1 RNA-binding transcriptional accessory protein [Rhizobium sp. MHM7A]